MKLKCYLLSTAVLAASIGVANAKDYVVGVESISYYPHYSYEGNTYSGFGRDLLDAFAADVGHNITYKAYPVKRLFKAFVAGEVDLKYPDNAYWGSDDKEGISVSYSAPVAAFIDGVVVDPSNKGKGLESLKKLGTVLGFTPWEYLGMIKEKKISVKENASFEALINQTVAGRIDGAYANIDVINHKLSGKDSLVFDETLPHTKGSYHLSSIKHMELIKEFDKWMASNEAKIVQIKDKYKLK